MVEVDIDDVLSHSATCQRDLRAFEGGMFQIADKAAKQARSRHAYQNHTGNLEASTQATVAAAFADSYVVDLQMGDENFANYASYVIDRGFSDFPAIAEKVEQDIGRLQASVGNAASTGNIRNFV